MTMFFKPITDWQEVFDQFLHAFLGGALVWLFSLNLDILLAFYLSMAIGVVREIVYQHWLTCGIGCRTDLAGWYVGSAIIAILIIFI